MVKVEFYESLEESLLQYAVVVARCHGKWVFCKHKLRNTIEIPGGHREAGENIDDAAARELWEETGAVKYEMTSVCYYSACTVDCGKEVSSKGYGKLYFAELEERGALPDFEMEDLYFYEHPPMRLEEWTYPEIQPKLFSCVLEFLKRRTVSLGG